MNPSFIAFKLREMSASTYEQYFSNPSSESREPLFAAFTPFDVNE